MFLLLLPVTGIQIYLVNEMYFVFDIDKPCSLKKLQIQTTNKREETNFTHGGLTEKSRFVVLSFAYEKEENIEQD